MYFCVATHQHNTRPFSTTTVARTAVRAYPSLLPPPLTLADEGRLPYRDVFKGLGEGRASSPLRRPQKWRRPIFLRPRALRRLQRRSPPPSEPDSEPPRPVDYACVRDSCTDACSACDRIDVFRPARPGPALPACELGVPRAAARKQKAAAEAPAAPRPKRGQRDPAAGEDAVAQRLAVAAATQQQKAEKKAAAELALAACRSAAAATKLQQKEMAAAARQAAAEKKAVAG